MHQHVNGTSITRWGELPWRKSRRSNPSGNCVELAPLPTGGIAVRNSRFPRGPVLVYSRDELAVLLAHVKGGVFDDPGI